MLKSESDLVQPLTDPDLTKLIRADLLDLLETKKSRAESYEVDGEVAEVFIELIQPPIQLMIFGGDSMQSH